MCRAELYRGREDEPKQLVMLTVGIPLLITPLCVLLIVPYTRIPPTLHIILKYGDQRYWYYYISGVKLGWFVVGRHSHNIPCVGMSCDHVRERERVSVW